MTQFKVDFNDFKRRDNTNLMEITLYKDNGEQIIPNRDHQWSGKALKFGDGDKRLDQELAVTLDGDKIGVPSKQLENLPSGDYGLELWETSNDSKTIYPSAGFVEFHIHRNADESLESVTPTVDIDKVIDDLHQAGLNVVVDGIEMLAPDATPSVTSEVRDGKNHIKLHIPRGFKGDIGPAPTLRIGTVTKLNPDQTPTAKLSGSNGSYTLDMGIPQGATGTVDNTGLTTAPAFQALQTQVADIKANGGGVNLAKGTSPKDQSEGDTGQTTGWVTPTIATFDNPQAGQQYTVSVNTRNNGGSWKMQVWDGTSPTNRGNVVYDGNHTLTPGQKQTVTITWPSGSNKYLIVQLVNGNDGGQIIWNSTMLEKGTVAHAWSPNPSEVLTQSDYAKIKAAIVALGGSLS